MSYCSTKEMAKTWGVSEGLVRRYCREGRVPTAVLEEEGWLIPEGTSKPGTPEAAHKYMIISPIAKRVVYEHGKNNHFGIYEYIQVNLAYSSCRMASNRLKRNQVIELYRTDKLMEGFWSILKCEMYYLNHFDTYEELVTAVEQFIHYYNHKRRQHKLNCLPLATYRSLLEAA